MSDAIAQTLTLPCGVTLPNRLVKAAMTEGLANEFNHATPAHAALYRRWAEGGSGVLITGNVQIHPDYLERPGNIVIDGEQSDEQLTALHAMAKAATDAGSHIWMQISHAGRQTPAAITKEPVAPSAVSVALPGGQFGTPRALTEAEILDIIQRFAHVALTARATGFSGVQIHAAHGYLLSEFLSPKVNLRTDEWGGSLENRARLLLGVVLAVRQKVGPAFPISVKLNSSDFQKGGFAFEECLKVVTWLEEAGVDTIELSGGNYEQPSMMGTEGIEPIFEEGLAQSTRTREAYFLNYAARIREVANVPLMVTGGFRSRAAMNAAIEEDGIALIGVARPFCADPDGPNLLLDHSINELARWEDGLRLGPWFLGPGSPITAIRAANGWAAQSWFCMQILKMGEGADPDTNMSAFKAMRQYMKNEDQAAKNLSRS